MTTRALAIRNAILVKLRASPVAGIPSARVYADLRQALNSALLPAIVVDLGDEPTPVREYGKRGRSVSIIVSILADGADPYTSIDPIRVAAHGLIMLDKTLGGLCNTIEEGDTSRTRADLDRPIGSLITVYTVPYTTAGEVLM